MAQSRERIDHAKHARWRQTLLRWESSGLSIRAFCKRERIHESVVASPAGRSAEDFDDLRFANRVVPVGGF